MRKTMNTICLVIWSIDLIFGVICMVVDTEISPVSYICAVLICIMHYAEELLNEKNNYI